jgi:hypothetical protein
LNLVEKLAHQIEIVEHLSLPPRIAPPAPPLDPSSNAYPEPDYRLLYVYYILFIMNIKAGNLVRKSVNPRPGRFGWTAGSGVTVAMGSGSGFQ